MIGMFDSGEGGMNVLRAFRGLCPCEDVIFLRDRARCPYGGKSHRQIIGICRENVSYLRSVGADEVLIACCTASAACSGEEWTDRRLHPIIDPVASAARRATENGKIALIATAATVASGAFDRSLGHSLVRSVACPGLVRMVEGGVKDGSVRTTDRAEIEYTLLPLSGSGADTLILGCTHFSSLRETVSDIAKKYGINKIIDSATEAARYMASFLRSGTGRGITYYAST